MGLDMYLYLRVSKYYSNCSWKKEEEVPKEAKYPKELKTFEKDILKRNFASVDIRTDYQIGYWRKVNAIHRWFVMNCGEGIDNGSEIWVSLDKAKELLDVIKQVKADHNLAPELLPTQEGFFFGSQEYDEWYWENLDYTEKLLEKTIKFCEENQDERYEIYYEASW